jgi:uncharacterized protein (DUF2141 family)
MKKIIMVLTLVFFGFFQNGFANSEIKINVKNVDKTKGGKILFYIFDSQQNWEKDNGKLIGEVQVDNLEGGLTINVGPSNYAISAFQDINNNNELDTNAVGIPEESYALSNIAKSKVLVCNPDWDDVQFAVKSGEIKNINLEFR